MKPASLHRRILFPLLLCGGLLFALLFWYFSPFFSPGEGDPAEDGGSRR